MVHQDSPHKCERYMIYMEHQDSPHRLVTQRVWNARAQKIQSAECKVMLLVELDNTSLCSYGNDALISYILCSLNYNPCSSTQKEQERKIPTRNLRGTGSKRNLHI